MVNKKPNVEIVRVWQMQALKDGNFNPIYIPGEDWQLVDFLGFDTRSIT